MKIDVITLFPEMFKGPFDESMVKRAQEKKLVTIGIHNLRKWAIDERGTVDAHPYGGGPGMLLRPEPISKSIEAIKQQYASSASEKFSPPAGGSNNSKQAQKVVLLDAGGELYNQEKAIQFSKVDHLICICGHYEGVDYRVHKMVDEVVSIGDFVMTGGELPTMMIVDSVVRLLPGVLNKEEATQKESFSEYSIQNTEYKMLEYPQYTRPEEFNGAKVPEVLLSGHHAEIEKWRKEQALSRTKKNRPDLLKP